MSDQPFELATYPIHLGLGARAIKQPEFDGEPSWYEGYIERHGKDGVEGRLVAWHTMRRSWEMWEVHPNGDEVVIVVSGAMTLIQDIDGQERRIELAAGQAAVNPPGVWHTADIEDCAVVVFITAGLGTEHKTRAV